MAFHQLVSNAMKPMHFLLLAPGDRADAIDGILKDFVAAN